MSAHPTRETVGPIGALDRWREELRVGKRTRATTDDLLVAAAWEAAGYDHRRDGLEDAASYCFRRAAEVIIGGAAIRLGAA